MRQLRLRMPDDSIRSITVDENQPVANLMVLICTKLGITNHDEYSLIATGAHTINGRRKERNDGRIIDQKMEQLKKKLKTDEDLAWVDHSKTLDEQEIHEQDVVVLRRRFFYSDQNVDSRDPIQLGVLYVQTRDAILSGTHPVTLDGACKFAGIQCQAQLGDFVEGKTTRAGYFNLKDYLPADYSKVKHIERRIFNEHKKYYGIGELEAKSRYVGEARSLPTYGVTFFLVKEIVAGKNKLVPRLLGITKDCVMRVDADSKGILKVWPLTTVKRWAASMNSFTLDFGDYSDSYYSVQTSEGEQISQLIAGYIDIILRRRKGKDHFGIEGDEGATMIEDSVAPSRATIIQNQGTLARPPSAAPSTQDLSSIPGPQVEKMKLTQGPIVEPPEFKPAFEVKGKAEIGYEAGPITQYVTNYELSLPQRDLQDRLEQAQDAIEEAQKVLDKPLSSDTLARSKQNHAQDLEDRKRELSNQFAGMNAATAQLVSLSAVPEEELNYTALNKAVETVATGLPSLTKDIKIVAAQMHDDRLIEAARRLCKAFSDLLNAAEPGPTVPRSSLISAASRVADETQTLLYTINDHQRVHNNTKGSPNGHGDSDDLHSMQIDDEYELQREQADHLLSLAKTVASSAANLVVKAKDVASGCRDEEDLQNTVIGSATQCALATSQMVATAKIVAPTIQDSQCQRKLIDSCREVQRAVQSIESSCHSAIGSSDNMLLCEVQEIVARVQRALDNLMEHVNGIRYHHYNKQTTSRHTTTSTTSKTVNHSKLNSHNNHNHSRHHHEHHDDHEEPHSSANSELVNQARTLAKATEKLILDIRPEHQSPGPNSTNQAYHNNNNKTTTITTTLYDERDRFKQQRPASYYDTETTTTTQQHQLPVTSSSTANAYDLLERTRILENSNNNNSNSNSNTTNNEIVRSTTTTTTTINHETNLHQHQHQQQQPFNSTNGLAASGDGQPPEAAISGILGDLETTIMFASAGTLRAQDEHDSYLYHRENVLRCAKALVEDSRPLVASASSDQAQLGHAVHESVITMSRLADTVKSSAASLGPNQVESQISLIKSVKEVAISLADLIQSTKQITQSSSTTTASGNDESRLYQVKDSAKSMVNSVTSLLKTVKSVEEEQQRGLRAIEATIEALEFELSNYGANLSILDNNNMHNNNNNNQMSCRHLGDELAKLCRPVTMATTKTIQAGSSGAQDDAIVAANISRKALIDLIQLTKSSLHIIESYELKLRCHETTKSCAQNYKHLLELLHKIFLHPSIASANPEIKQDLIAQSKLIASNVTDLMSCSELIKASSSASSQQQQHQPQVVTSSMSGLNTGADYPMDPNVIAESELLGAASSIDAAAKKLENLKPRVTSVKLPHEDLNFDEIILEAAKSIIEATAALLRAASASQRELLVDGRLDETETFYASDTNQWSEGLVSAARMVAAATHSLVEAANALVQGQASEERLISAAKQVASSTNQLLVACKVKADPDSRTITRLSNAGNQVKRATDNLVHAAQQAIEHDEEQSLVISNRKVSGIAQEISAREQILRKEKELQVAKTQLMAIRKAKYSNRPDDYQGYGGSLA